MSAAKAGAPSEPPSARENSRTATATAPPENPKRASETRAANTRANRDGKAAAPAKLAAPAAGALNGDAEVQRLADNVQRHARAADHHARQARLGLQELFRKLGVFVSPPDDEADSPMLHSESACAVPATDSAEDPAEPEPAAPALAPKPPPEPIVPATFQNHPANPETWAPEDFREPLRAICGFDLAGFKYEDEPTPVDVDALPGWRLLLGTTRGRTHATEGQHREDGIWYERDAEKQLFTIVAVSDGAGSCEYSRIGSEVTCRLVCQEVKAWAAAHLPGLQAPEKIQEITDGMRGAMQAAVSLAAEKLTALATATSQTPNQFNCTLLLAALVRCGEETRLFFAQAGDGAIATLSVDNSTKNHSKALVGQYGGLVADFLPGAAGITSAQKISAGSAARLRAILLCSDGIEDAFYPMRKGAATIFMQLCRGVEKEKPADGFRVQKPHGPVLGSSDAAANLKEWLQFERKGENDDRSIAVFYRVPLGDIPEAFQPEPPPPEPPPVEPAAAVEPEPVENAAGAPASESQPSTSAGSDPASPSAQASAEPPVEGSAPQPASTPSEGGSTPDAASAETPKAQD